MSDSNKPHMATLFGEDTAEVNAFLDEMLESVEGEESRQATRLRSRVESIRREMALRGPDHGIRVIDGYLELREPH